MKILLTGGAGFIGNTLALRLLSLGHTLVVVDVVNDYYDPTLKEARLARLPETVAIRRVDIANRDLLEQIFLTDGPFDAVAHLAAQAGVRYSLENPFAYAESNYAATLNIFELAKRHQVPNIVFASSSSVYGKNKDMPFTEESRVDTPVSIYAASKRACELLAYSYVDLFKMNITALRFFTVYGPWGRPDMALFKFTKAMLDGEPIELYNGGDMRRDFTYVDDIVAGFVGVLTAKPGGFEIFNLGNGSPVYLREFVKIIERELQKQAQIIEKPMQLGDVSETYADISKARRMLGYEPKVSVEEGVRRFVEWYREYYGSSGVGVKVMVESKKVLI